MALNSHIQKEDFRFIGGIAVSVNAGTADAGTQRVIIASDQSAIPVSATNLDIRDLTSVSDSVSAVQSGTWVLGANSGTDIGDVTINNAAGASAVNIQDGGNSITVDNAGLTELAAAINASSQMDVNIAASAVDVMLGTDFSNVFGSTSLIRATQEDDIETTADGIQTTSFLYVYDGTAWDRARGTSGNGLLVDLGGNNDVTVSGTVSVNTLGNGTTGPQKAEDALSANQDVGIPAMAVQKATPANTAGTDGDYEFLQMSAGRLWASAVIDTALPAGDNNIGNVDIASIAAGDAVIGRVKLSDGTDVADILDLTNSNPLTVAIVDGDGTQITSFGGGTQYTEDAAAAANPVGTALILIREDARGGSLTTTDGDNVAARGNNKGELYVKTTDSDALLTTIDADTSNISTKIDTLAGAVSGTEFQVDVLSMPTVTVNAHNVTNAGTFAVQVDGAALTALQLIDDAVYVDDADWTDNTSKHLLVGGVYQSAPHTVTDGDVTPFLTDVNGRLIAAVTDNGGSLTVDNAGLTELAAAINASSQLDVNIAASAISFGGTSAADDADFTATTTLGTPAMGVYESTPTNVTDGDMGIVGITTDRRLKVLADLSATDNAVLDAIAASVSAIDTDATTIIGHVDGIEALLGTIDTDTGNIVTAVQLIDNAIHVDDAAFTLGTSSGVMMMGFAGTQSVNANDAGAISMETDGSVHIHDGGNTITVDGTVTANLSATDNQVLDNIDADTSAIQTAVELIDDTVYVDDADWTADTSKHTLVGAVTQVATTANTDGDVTPLTTNAFRELRVAIPESDLATAGTAHVKKYYTNAGAVTDGIIWSPAAGKRWYITDIFIGVSADATVTLEDDKAGGDEVVWKHEVSAKSGWDHTFNTPLFSGEDAADLIITTTTGNVYVLVVGYEV